MLRINEIKLPLDHDATALRKAILNSLGIPDEALLSFTVFKRSYDARKKTAISLIYQVDVELPETLESAILEGFAAGNFVRPAPDTVYRYVTSAGDAFPGAGQRRPLIIGFGPCGLLAALVLAQMGFRPIVLERGQDVRQRTKDTWGLWRERKLNTESNVQFGEGGAGTFSDGKLYSQVKDKRHLGRKVLTEFVKAGAPPEILYVSKPHIGTFKLVKMVEAMRAEIIALGGEIRFGQKVETLHRDSGNQGAVQGVTLASGERIDADHIILAIGHSARDTFEMLRDQGVHIEPKPFSIGLRIEHPQSVIDAARFGYNAGHPILGAADYKLVHHCANGRSVYSFCMCPGGTVVAATSEEGRVVTNGMSQYSRNERNANAAIVVGIDPDKDFPGDVLAGIELQRELEAKAFRLGGENYNAPAQRVGDFMQNKPPGDFGEVVSSYKPGVTPCNLAELLPPFAVDAIREAIPEFNRQIRGFAMADAVLTGVETRTSAPICIRRDKTLQSLNTPGLYPAGEGAGYAGGILSAGIDGIKAAEAVALSMMNSGQS